MEIHVEVGPQSKASADGTKSLVRAGRTGEIIVSDLHGRYVEQTRSGNMFSAANQAAQAVSVALSTTYTGILLYNPVNSGKVLFPNKFKYALSVAQVAIASLGLISGYAATGGITGFTTALTVRSNQVGNSAVGSATVWSAATITTPVWHWHTHDGFTAGALAAPQAIVDIEGAIAILPGGFLAIGALTAVTGLGSISWEELDAPGGAL